MAKINRSNLDEIDNNNTTLSINKPQKIWKKYPSKKRWWDTQISKNINIRLLFLFSFSSVLHSCIALKFYISTFCCYSARGCSPTKILKYFICLSFGQNKAITPWWNWVFYIFFIIKTRTKCPYNSTRKNKIKKNKGDEDAQRETKRQIFKKTKLKKTNSDRQTKSCPLPKRWQFFLMQFYMQRVKGKITEQSHF